jgi:hypothetical protein
MGVFGGLVGVPFHLCQIVVFSVNWGLDLLHFGFRLVAL